MKDMQSQPEKTHQVVADVSDEEEYTIYRRATKSLVAGVKLNGIQIAMEVDMGASVSIMSEESFKSL